MPKKFELLSHVEDALGPFGDTPYCRLASNQPLLLALGDATVLVSDLYNIQIGWVNPSHTAKVAARIRAGDVLLAKVAGKCLCVYRPILIWSDGTMEVETTTKQTELV